METHGKEVRPHSASIESGERRYVQLPRRRLEIGTRTLIMGVLNVTPDSFSDAGLFLGTRHAIDRALRMVEEGADIVDIGGESTRPGSRPVEAQEQLRRVMPVMEGLAGRLAVPLSIDTTCSEVARRAVEAGAAIVNDISALRADPEMAEVVAWSDAAVILVHMLGTPRTMQDSPVYSDVIGEVKGFLSQAVARAAAAGIERSRTIVDPGIGFGKTAEHNLAILANLQAFAELGRPVLAGPSRKSFIGQILGLPVEERLEGTAAAVAAAVANGADIVRVHDVIEMVRVVRVADAIKRVRAGG